MKQISVLMIEDSIYAADLNAREISKAGFLVSYKRIYNVKAMLQALQEGKWDIILSDNSMQNFDALRALEIRNKFDNSIPFVVVSEYVSKEDLSIAVNNGCNAYINKDNLIGLREFMNGFCNI